MRRFYNCLGIFIVGVILGYILGSIINYLFWRKSGRDKILPLP